MSMTLLLVCLLTVLANGEGMVTCGDVKDMYRHSTCCGQPAKAVSMSAATTQAFSAATCPLPGFCDCAKLQRLLGAHKDLCVHADMLKPVGGIDQVICEASDAGAEAMYLMDGKAGNANFPHGNFKVLATAGEVNPITGSQLTGTPDGIGAYLKDADTVRVVYQSESYGQTFKITRGPGSETVPWPVNDGAASLTGSHVHFVDYDRAKMADFMNTVGAAVDMVTDSGELPVTMYNLKKEKVGPRQLEGPTMHGAHSSNVDVQGNYIVAERTTRDVATTPTKADWLMQSLCSAHLETKHQWGAGMGVEDDLFITNEEWIYYKKNVATGIIGLPAHVLDLTTRTFYATAAFTLGGFEKIVEVNTGTNDFVAFSPSGYNGAFYTQDKTTEYRNGNYTRTDGNPYVYPQNIVPARIYLGKKNTAKDGSADSTFFMARNGFEYGANYGFAVDCSLIQETRDDWHKTAQNGDTVQGAFYKMRWTHTPGEVQAFEHDGAWEFQDAPEGAPTGWCFWNGQGKDDSGKKTEHNSPDPRGASRFIQGSTAGYFGIYDFSAVTALLQEGSFPQSIPATYTVKQGSTDIDEMIKLGGMGKTADGNNATQFTDKDKTVKRFEDIDALEWMAASNNDDYLIIHEDGKNSYGERKFVAKMGDPIIYYFAAMSGGPLNSRIVAGVSAIEGAVSRADGHEFSGGFDLSGLLHKDADGKFSLAYPAPPGEKRRLDSATPINEKTMLVSLQAHSNLGATVPSFYSDRISQVLMFQPNIPEE